MLSGGASSVLGLLYWILASRLYSPSAVGTSSSAIAALMFLTGVATLYLDGSLIRFLPRAGRRTNRLVVGCYALTLAVAAVVALAFVASVDVVAPGLGFVDSSWVWWLACVGAVMAACMFTLQDGVLTGIRRTFWVPIENIAYSVAKIALLVVLAGTATENGILISWVAPFVLIIPLVSMLLLRLMRRHAAATSAIAEEITRERVARYALGNYAGFLFLLVYTRLPPVLVLNESGSSASAFFYLPWMIAGTLMLLTINVSVSLIVEGTVDRDNANVLIKRAVLHVARLLLPIVAVLFVAAPYVLRLFGEEYADAGSSLLRILAVAAIPNAVCILAFGVARLQDRVRVLVLAQFALAVLVLGIGTALLPGVGIEGMGLGWLIGQSVVAAVLFVKLLRPLWVSASS